MTTASIIHQIASKIIKEQELIIGPLAWLEASKVSGLTVIDPKKEELEIDENNPKQVIDRLVAQYERLFGKASKEVCKEAAASFLSNLSVEDIPISLK